MLYFEALVVLGLNNNATEAEIKSAYRQKAKLHHPDVGGNAEDFVRLKAAYNVALVGVGKFNIYTNVYTSPTPPKAPSDLTDILAYPFLILTFLCVILAGLYILFPTGFNQFIWASKIPYTDFDLSGIMQTISKAIKYSPRPL